MNEKAAEIQFINFKTLNEEQYLKLNKENIEKFNASVLNKGEPGINRSDRLVKAAYRYSERISFLSKSSLPSETTKLIVVALAARSQMYHQKCLREKLKRYIFPELKIEVIINEKDTDNREFLIIPSLLCWDSLNDSHVNDSHNHKDRFFTVSLICLPKRDKSLTLIQMSEFINKIGLMKHHGIQIKILENQSTDTVNFYEVTKNSKELLEVYLQKLIEKIYKLLNAHSACYKKQDEEFDFENLMTSAICDISSGKDICVVSDYTITRNFTNNDKAISKILFSFLYKYFWTRENNFKFEEINVSDILVKLSQDQILHYPYNISCFFSENKHLSLNILLEKESFPFYSGIWALGLEILANENISTRICRINFYNNKLSEIEMENNHHSEISDISKKLTNIRNNKILDFEAFDNMESDDPYMVQRINKMKIKIGLTQKYQSLNQCIDSISTYVTEKENENLQRKVIGLTYIVIIIGAFTFAAAVWNGVFNEAAFWVNLFIVVLVGLVVLIITLLVLGILIKYMQDQKSKG